MQILTNTPQTYYLLGLLWADGYVNINYTGLELISTDMKDITQTILTTNNKWKFYYRSRQHFKPSTTARLGSREFSRFLISYNYRSKDGSPTILETIPKKWLFLWFRGLFDGDGCIYQSKDGYNSQLCISSTFYQDWSYMENIYKSLGVSYTIKKSIYKSQKSSVIRSTSRKSIVKFYDYIYQSLNDIGISRKHNKFTEVADTF